MMISDKQDIFLEEAMPLISEVLQEGKSVQFKPKGISMLPLLRPGRDSVLLSSPPEKLKKYDVVLYRRDSGAYILHRINVVGETYTCMGDNQFRYEEGIRREQIIGIMTAFFRDEKKYNVKSIGYQIYSYVWPTRCRIRMFCMRILVLIKKVRKKYKNV